MASCSILTPYMQFTVTKKDTGCGTAVYTCRKGIGGFWIWLCFSFYVKSIGCQHRRAQDCLYVQQQMFVDRSNFPYVQVNREINFNVT